jgi:hypothetical protein
VWLPPRDSDEILKGQVRAVVKGLRRARLVTQARDPGLAQARALLLAQGMHPDRHVKNDEEFDGSHLVGPLMYSFEPGLPALPLISVLAVCLRLGRYCIRCMYTPFPV